MIQIHRRFNNQSSFHKIYTKDECDKKGRTYVYWKDAEAGDMALSDDNYVGECISRKIYQKNLVYIKTIYGVQFAREDNQLLFMPNHKMGVYSLIKPRFWYDREANTVRVKNTVDAYVSQLLSPFQVDWDILGNIYRPDQKNPRQTVKRLFKQEVVKDMIEDKLKAVLSEKGITKSFVLDKMLNAIEIAENKGDVGGILKAADSFMDLLEMKPSKRVITDTMQIDVSNQIMDQIETEEKKLLMSRKTESKESANGKQSVSR